MTIVEALQAIAEALGGTPTGDTSAEILVEIAELLEDGGGAGTYVLPKAAADTLGGVKVGSNLSINSDGVLSATDTTYSAATTEALGLVKVDGTTIQINDGVISVVSG